MANFRAFLTARVRERDRLRRGASGTTPATVGAREQKDELPLEDGGGPYIPRVFSRETGGRLSRLPSSRSDGLPLWLPILALVVAQ